MSFYFGPVKSGCPRVKPELSMDGAETSFVGHRGKRTAVDSVERSEAVAPRNVRFSNFPLLRHTPSMVVPKQYYQGRGAHRI